MGAVAAGAVIVGTSAAFACLTPKGQITVTGVGAGNSTTSKAVDIPAHAMFCNNITSAVTADTSNGLVTVVVQPSTCVSIQTKLASGTAAVVLQHDGGGSKYGWAWVVNKWVWQTDDGCFGGSKPATTTLGSFSVTSTGYASAMFTIPATAAIQTVHGATNAGHICVKDSTGNDGAFAPIRLN